MSTHFLALVHVRVVYLSPTRVTRPHFPQGLRHKASARARTLTFSARRTLFPTTTLQTHLTSLPHTCACCLPPLHNYSTFCLRCTRTCETSPTRPCSVHYITVHHIKLHAQVRGVAYSPLLSYNRRGEPPPDLFYQSASDGAAPVCVGARPCS